MGPTNIALVTYFQADIAVRQAQARYEAATHDVRIQSRRVSDLTERHRAMTQQLREAQAHSARLDLELKARDEHIEKLRTQQQSAKSNREYQAFLIEINTAKVDRAKLEDEGMKALEGAEKLRQELADLHAHVEAERAKLQTMQGQIEQRTADLRAEIERLKPLRDAAAERVPPKPREVFERLQERTDGEAMAPIDRPDPRREEYICTACNMEIVIDIYNKLHARDEVVFCPSCRRMLYIPAELPGVAPPAAPKPAKAKPARSPRAARGATRDAEAVDPAKAELHRLLLKAAAESGKIALAAGEKPADYEVYVDGQRVGSYRGQNADHLRRAARYYFSEAGLVREIAVYDKGAGPAEVGAAAPVEAVEQPADPAAPAPTPALADAALPAPLADQAELMDQPATDEGDAAEATGSAAGGVMPPTV